MGYKIQGKKSYRIFLYLKRRWAALERNLALLQFVVVVVFCHVENKYGKYHSPYLIWIMASQPHGDCGEAL